MAGNGMQSLLQKAKHKVRSSKHAVVSYMLADLPVVQEQWLLLVLKSTLRHPRLGWGP